jgi:phosphonate transport system substrate-binding protein
MIAKRPMKAIVAATGLSLALLLSACGKTPDTVGAPAEIRFSIVGAEDAAQMASYWQPLVDDLQKKTGLKVKLFFSPNYSLLVQAMAGKQTQLAWFSALPAAEAVERANAEVFARTIDTSGSGAYQSVIIARKDGDLTQEKLMACDKTLTFGIGDAQSTTGTLAPLTFLFRPAGKTPQECFKTVRSANHQANLLAVANGLVDAATNNTTGLAFYRTGTPEAQAAMAKVKVIWTSPDLPESAMVYRKDLDPAVQAKLRDFFITYGKGEGPQAEHERAVLKTLKYSRFDPAENAYLQPVIDMRNAQAAATAAAK